MDLGPRILDLMMDDLHRRLQYSFDYILHIQVLVSRSSESSANLTESSEKFKERFKMFLEV